MRGRCRRPPQERDGDAGAVVVPERMLPLVEYQRRAQKRPQRQKPSKQSVAKVVAFAQEVERELGPIRWGALVQRFEDWQEGNGQWRPVTTSALRTWFSNNPDEFRERRQDTRRHGDQRRVYPSRGGYDPNHAYNPRPSADGWTASQAELPPAPPDEDLPF